MKLNLIDNEKTVVSIIFIIGFIIRLMYLNTLEISGPIRGDASFYAQYANNMIEYGVFSKDRSVTPRPDSYWAPGYPAFLAMCMLVAKLISIHFYYVVLGFQVVIGGLIGSLTYILSRSIFSVSWTILVCGLTILSPHLITHGGYVLSETLFSFLLLSSICLYIKVSTSKYSVILNGVSGFIFGLAYLTNPVSLVAPILIFIRSIYGEVQTLVNRKSPYVFLLSFLLVVALWNIRNLVSLEDTGPSSYDRAFENLIIGSHSDFHKILRANPKDKNNPYELDISKYRDNHYDFYRELASRIIENPSSYAKWYFLRKPMELWGWDILVGQGDVYVFRVESSLYYKSKWAIASLVIMKQLHYWLFLLAIMGFFFMLLEKDGNSKFAMQTIYISTISISIIYVILHSDARYSVALRPEMYICAVYSAHNIFKFIRMLILKNKKIL